MTSTQHQRRLFDPNNATQSRRHRTVYAMFTLAVSMVNFLAAVLFIIGSVYYFNPETNRQGTWMFLIGSIFFAVAPTLKLIREIRLVFMDSDPKKEAKAADIAVGI